MFDMISNVLKNLSVKPVTRNYPVEKRDPFAGGRGRVGGIAIDQCIFCGICVRKCPADAIAVEKVNKSWELDPFKCVICGECAAVCPKKCIFMDEMYTPAVAAKEKLKYVQQPQPIKKTETQVG